MTQTCTDVTVRLPRLLAAREAVAPLLEREGVPASLQGDRVVLQCRDLAASSPSFAEELFRVLVKERKADSVLLVSPPESFWGYLNDAAGQHGEASRLSR